MASIEEREEELASILLDMDSLVDDIVSSSYCKNYENYKKLAEQKRSIINKMIEAGHYNFDYAILPDLVIRNKEIRGPIYLNNAKIYGNVIFYNTVVNDAVYLRNAYIKGNVELTEFEIEGILSIMGTEIKGNLVIQDSLRDGDLE